MSSNTTYFHRIRAIETRAKTDALALRILAAAKGAGFAPALYDWDDVTEDCDLFCLVYGSDLQRPSPYDVHRCAFATRWWTAYRQARNEWRAVGGTV